MKVIMLGNWRGSSAIIRLFTFSRWHHCGIIDGDNVIEPRPFSGVKYTPIESFKNRGRWMILDIPLEYEEQALEWTRDQIGKPYDYTALIRFIFHREWEQDEKWYCSELVGYILNNYKERTFSPTARGVLPRDIVMLPFKVLEVGYK